ncbi:aminopeptidase N-like [Nylanderia fulva]|uniref:aminopeptidase N-like n=1 Tax=Nylanderia fulva TaxID=613905 RepID=UPI0010FB0BA0|nr:aminopeptidase N-like [Nylanderia fulva]
MWTNHATVIVSNYLFIFNNKNRIIKMRYRHDTGFDTEFARNVAENITMYFKNKWKDLNYISMMGHVAIPNFHDKVFRFVFSRETDIVYDKNLYPVAHKIQVTQLVGHAVAQQWFYNLNQQFPSFWFNKGLTTLLATYAVNEIYPDYRIINLFVVQNLHYSFHLDSMCNSTSEDMSLFKIRQFIKAPFILRMMQHAFTEEIFWTLIRSYINKTTILNFWKVIVTTAMKLNIALDIMRYRDCPTIKIIRNYKDAMSQANVSIQNIDTLFINCLLLTFTTQTSPDFNHFTYHEVCRSRDLKLSASKENGWIIFNIQQIGYYRVNYDDENWRRISHYLNHDDYTKIHVLNRAQIIDDAFHLMIAGQLNSSIFWDIILYLNREEDYIAWYPMFKALEYMFGTSFLVLKEKHGNLKNYINDKLNGVFKRIKYEEIDDSDDFRKCLRQEAARWACFFGDITCKEKANNKLKQHIEDPKTHRLLPWWKEWTYCNGLMMTKEETTWQSVYDIGLNKSDTKFLEYLACPEDTNLIKKYLTFRQNISTEQEYPNHFNSFLHIITKHAKNQIILEYILDHFNEIKPKYVSTPAALIIIINNVYFLDLTEQIFDSVRDIIETNLVEVNNTDLLKRQKRHQTEEMSDIVINKHNLRYQLRRKINIRNNQTERQRQNFEIFCQCDEFVCETEKMSSFA